jgi:hypothetical protein
LINMQARIQEVLDYLDTRRAALRAAIDAIPASARSTRPAPDRWSAAEVVEHLAMVEGRMAHGIFEKKIAAARSNGLAAETEASSVTPTFDATGLLDRAARHAAPDAVAPKGTLSADAAWAELERARERLRASLMSADGLALGQIEHAHPTIGAMNLYQWALWIGSHEARHTAQVKEIAAAVA